MDGVWFRKNPFFAQGPEIIITIIVYRFVIFPHNVSSHEFFFFFFYVYFPIRQTKSARNKFFSQYARQCYIPDDLRAFRSESFFEIQNNNKTYKNVRLLCECRSNRPHDVSQSIPAASLRIIIIINYYCVY